MPRTLENALLGVSVNWICPQVRRSLGPTTAPINVGWNGKFLLVGATGVSCLTSLADPCIPNAAGALTAPNNAVDVNLTAGNWATTRAVGATFGSSDAGGPFTCLVGQYYNTLAGLTRVNSLVSTGETPSLYEFTGPLWPVWLGRGLGSSDQVPTGGIAIDVSDFAGRQSALHTASTVGLIVHPDDQARVMLWIPYGATTYAASFILPSTLSTAAGIGTVVTDAYQGYNRNTSSWETARGVVVDLATVFPRVSGLMRLKGYRIRS